MKRLSNQCAFHVNLCQRYAKLSFHATGIFNEREVAKNLSIYSKSDDFKKLFSTGPNSSFLVKEML